METYNTFRDRIYGYILAYKKNNLTTESGEYNGRINEYVLPESFWSLDVPAMLYGPIKETVKAIQSSPYRYKPHIFAYNHIASSQTACVNLFVPILESSMADSILKQLSCCPPDFDHIDRDVLFHGYRFEFWDSIDESNKGILGDHTKRAGTDSDVAISYRNKKGDSCLWLIEHKLTEREFTECGGYKSKGNSHKDYCKKCNMNDLLVDPDKCHYHHQSHYNYWRIMQENSSFFSGYYKGEGCPFRGGMNQLWRNQLLAISMENAGIFKQVSFSVVFHPENHFLNASIDEYHMLTNNSIKFSSFKSSELINAAAIDPGLYEWTVWYKTVYYGK